jgi:hypothetical protein
MADNLAETPLEGGWRPRLVKRYAGLLPLAMGLTNVVTDTALNDL